jgi:hypothetical protein
MTAAVIIARAPASHHGATYVVATGEEAVVKRLTIAIGTLAVTTGAELAVLFSAARYPSVPYLADPKCRHARRPMMRLDQYRRRTARPLL